MIANKTFLVIILVLSFASSAFATSTAIYEVPENWRELLPLINLLKSRGIEFDGSPAEFGKLIQRLRNRTGLASENVTASGFDKLFSIPTEDNQTDETVVYEGETSTVTFGIGSLVDFSTRRYWFAPIEYRKAPHNKKYKLTGIPVRQDIYFDADANNYIDSDKEALDKARNYVRSGEYAADIDRRLARKALKSYKEEEARLDFERDQGLIPDYELPMDSEIKFEGRKLFTMGYSRTNYDSGYTVGDGTDNDINMEGELQLRIEGTIMRKTHVYVDYDDTRENDNRNRISVIYKGDPDELVQEAAFGDIILSLPSTEFVSYSSSRNVFGAKIDMKYKWARLMAIASQEKGKAEEATFTGGNELTTVVISDENYDKRKYYRVNAGRDPNAEEHPDYLEYGNVEIEVINGRQKFGLYIYRPGKPIGSIPTNLQKKITAYEFEDNDVFTIGSEGYKDRGGSVYSEYHASWELLEPTVDYSLDTETGIVTMLTTVNQEDSLAVAYSITDGANSYYVGYDSGGTIDYTNMKLLKTNGLGGNLQRYELKNRYSLGSTNIINTSLIVKMRDATLEEKFNDIPYFQIFGMDRNNDNEIDSTFIDTTFGTLIVPDEYVSSSSTYIKRDRINSSEGVNDEYNDFLPFDYRSSPTADRNDESEGDGIVEDIDGNDAYSPGTIDGNYSFLIEYQSAKPSYFLRPNIIPGSVVVTLNGKTLSLNSDYWVDYDSGFIEFLTDEVNMPDAQLTISYEYKPFFDLQTKSLLGARFAIGPNDYNFIAFTWLGEFTEKLRGNEKAELGGEPANQTVFDADLKIEIYPDIMTKMADILPLVHTKEKSKLQFEAEIARSYRNPNIMGEARVEDFEGARQDSSFPMTYRAWAPSSAPAPAEFDQTNRTMIRYDDEKVFLDDIDPSWPKDSVDALLIANLPNETDDVGAFIPTWGSIVRPISIVGQDFIESNYETLTITFNLNKLNTNTNDDITGGKLHIDIGEVSEDTDEDGEMDTEDGTGAKKDRDDELQLDEDNGWTFDNTGVGGDDDNILINIDKKLDEEDLDRNDTLDTTESYFTYEIDFGDIINGTSPYLSRSCNDAGDTLEEGWYIAEIPLELESGLADTWNNPDATKIKHLRVWFESEDEADFPEESHIYFQSISLSAMRWEEAIVSPELGLNEINLTAKDSRHDADYVPLNPTASEDDASVTNSEQAIVLEYTFTDWDDIGVFETETDENGEVIGVRVYGANNGVFDTEDINRNGILDNGEDIGVGPPADPIGANNQRLDQEPPIIGYTSLTGYSADDYSNYKQMHIWVYNANPRPDTVGESGGNGQDYMFVRFGADDENYFEYKQQLSDEVGWERKNIRLDFFDKLRLKGVSLTDNEIAAEIENYVVVGSPSLLNIQELFIGVGTNNPFDGGHGGYIEPREVWFNDIYLNDIDKTEGVAKRAEIETDFGGFIRLRGSGKNVDSDFSTVGTVSTRDQETTDLYASGSLEFAKLMPDKWGIRLPLSGSWGQTETITEEKYDSEQSIYTQGRVVSTTKSVGLSYDKYKTPSIDLSYRNSYSTNDTHARTSDTDTYSVSSNYTVYPQKQYLPRTLSASFTRKLDRTNYAESKGVNSNRNWRTDSFRSGIKFEPIRDFTLEPGYSYNATVDQMDETEEGFSEAYTISTKYDRIKGVRPNIKYSSSYSETAVESFDSSGSGTGMLSRFARYKTAGMKLGKGETLNVAVTANLSTSCPINIGNLTNHKANGINKLSVSPSYNLVRSSTYYDEAGRPGMDYRFGRTTALENPDNMRTAKTRHTVSVSNRFNPLEFLGYRVGTKWENYDFIQMDFDASYTHDDSNTTGTISRTRTLTFPDVTSKLSGSKNFPIFAPALKRSTITLNYTKRKTRKLGYTTTVRHSPGASWRATWKADGLRTRIDFLYDQTRTEYLDPDLISTGSGEPFETETSTSPTVTLNYDWKMPRGFKIPILGTLRWRNELSLETSVGLVQTRYENTGLDESDQWNYKLSGGYYLATSLHLNITGIYSTFTNLSTTGSDYDTISVTGDLEIIF